MQCFLSVIYDSVQSMKLSLILSSLIVYGVHVCLSSYSFLLPPNRLDVIMVETKFCTCSFLLYALMAIMMSKLMCDQLYLENGQTSF